VKTKKATPEQIEAAKTRRAALAASAKRIAAMPESDRVAAFGNRPLMTVEGHSLSVKNSCLALTQCPTATVLGGFVQWSKAGRKVSKGSKAIGIFLPCNAKADEESGEPGGVFFRVVNVFDIDQTEPAEEPAAV
jgi:hypothetical protein